MCRWLAVSRHARKRLGYTQRRGSPRIYVLCYLLLKQISWNGYHKNCFPLVMCRFAAKKFPCWRDTKQCKQLCYDSFYCELLVHGGSPAEKSDVKTCDLGQLWKVYFAYSMGDVPRKWTWMPENFFGIRSRQATVIGLNGRHLCIWYLVLLLYKSMIPVLEFLKMPSPSCSHIVLIIHSQERLSKQKDGGHMAAKENRCKYNNKTHLVVCNALILCLKHFKEQTLNWICLARRHSKTQLQGQLDVNWDRPTSWGPVYFHYSAKLNGWRLSALCAQWIQFVMSSKSKPTVNSIFFLLNFPCKNDNCPWNHRAMKLFLMLYSRWFKINSDMCPEMDGDYDTSTQIQPKEGCLLSAFITHASMNIKDWFLLVFSLSVPGESLS